MHVARLSLTNFRNYIRLELELAPGLTVFVGDNAQGKTNLLEAIYFLATTKSPRANTDREVINWLAAGEDIPFARLSAQVRRAKDSLSLEIGILGERGAFAVSQEPSLESISPALPLQGPTIYVQKQFRINGVPKRASDTVGQVNVVMFASQDIDLTRGAPSMRRRYLDVTNSQVDPLYLRALQRYTRVHTQRNHLLRLIQERRARTEELAFWDKELTGSGSYLIFRRRKMVSDLDELARQIHWQLTEGQERLDVNYLGKIAVNERKEPSQDAIVDAFRNALHNSREEDIVQGMSLVGPHRDDLRFLVNGMDMSVYSSRGQQRTIALSLRLGEAKYMELQTGEQPILLLDDVLSELDAKRREHLMEAAVSCQQAIITTTDLDRIPPRFIQKARVFRVHQGRIEPLI